ncbi:MAG TPA: TlpA disulfide reductase family protein [Pyrinomonadaceae bacterium]|nr:TlpA disulfide reductase family protein [Pyrinomonadaceae bacterium]
MKTVLSIAVLILSFVLTAAAQTGEQAPILEKDVQYKDWTYKSVRDDGREMNLRELARGKKLVLVVYYAPWCPNWRNEAPIAQKLYEKYKASGLEVVGVGEYDTVEKMKANLETLKITFPVVYESDALDAKQKTLHYTYRKTTGDTRNWGSPWNIFLEPNKLEKKGDVLLSKAHVVNGELIETEAEAFIRQKLGLSAATEDKKVAETNEKPIEPCTPEKKVAEFKKP